MRVGSGILLIAFCLVEAAAAFSQKNPLIYDRREVGRRLADGGVLTEADKQELLTAHNDYRSATALGNTGSQPMASDMLEMVWNETLAVSAKAHADLCKFEHGIGSYGENIFHKSGILDNVDNINTLKSGINSWYKENGHYNYDFNNCSDVCGHYTQVVWASSTSVGCGYAECGPANVTQYPYQVLMVCRYSPPGNYIGVKPYTSTYKTSLIASQCPADYYSDSTSGLCKVNTTNTTIISPPSNSTNTTNTTNTTKIISPPSNSTNTTNTTKITIATLTPILDLNEYNISDPTCTGSITSSFEESVTCSMTKFVGTNVSLEFLDGDCTGSTIGNLTENVDNSTITGTILPDFNITGAGNETYSFCLVAKSFFADEVITEVKTLGTVTYYYTASGNFTLNVTTEALVVGEVLADATADEVTLEAYQCLDDGSVDQNAPVAYQQGSTLSVCLESSQPSLVLLTSVDMVISPFSSGFSPSLIVDDDVPVKSALTLVNSLSDQTIIQIKTVLISLFFLDPQNKVLVQGSANFIYKTRKERMLRIMQSADDVGSSAFDLVVDLEPNEAGIYDVSSPSSSSFLSMFMIPLLPLLFTLL